MIIPILHFTDRRIACIFIEEQSVLTLTYLFFLFIESKSILTDHESKVE